MGRAEFTLDRFYEDCRRLPGPAGKEVGEILQAGSVFGRTDPSNPDRCAAELSLALRLNGGDPSSLLMALTDFFQAQRKPVDLSFTQVAKQIYEAPFYPTAEHLIFAFPYGQKRADTILDSCKGGLARSRSGATVLDVGVGPGVIARRLMDQRGDLKLDILDVSDRCLSYAARVLEGKPVRSSVQTDFRAYLPEEKYDLIIASEVVEHVESPLDALAHLRSCLAYDGTLVVGVPIQLPMTMHLTVFASVEQVYSLAEQAGFLIDEGSIYPLYGRSLNLALRLVPAELVTPPDR